MCCEDGGLEMTQQADVKEAIPATKRERLDFIKKRHRELILDSRDETMEGLIEGDDALDSYEETEDIQYIEETYNLNAGM
jgi:hypothetical protein